VTLYNDEPALEDALGRDKMAAALAESVSLANTPLSVGIYGSWGSGKTTLMRLIEDYLTKNQKKDVDCIWFDPWFHQFDDSPEVALLHAMSKSVRNKEKLDQVKKLLTIIGASLANAFIKPTIGMSIEEIEKLGEKYEEMLFEKREKRTLLNEHFSSLIDMITDKGKKRLVIFIDDLDRCSPNTVMKMLDSLKLYLSHPGCIYIIGMDRVIVEKSIQSNFIGVEGTERDYLDKIVQLPFSIPVIGKHELEQYINKHLPDEFASITKLFINGLSKNPRKIKRFINAYLLSYSLARSMENLEIDKEILGLVLLIQHLAPSLYMKLVHGDKSIAELLSKKRRDIETIKAAVDGDIRLAAVLENFKVVDNVDWNPYIFLSKTGTFDKRLIDVWITEIGTREPDIIRVFRTLTGVSIAEAKNKIKDLPLQVASGLDKEEAEHMLRELENVGAEVEFR